jgi:excisionase family DNA binding protein
MTPEVSTQQSTAAAPAVAVPNQKLAYSRKEAARMLSISIRQLDYLVDANEIPVMRVGARVLVTHQTLQQFLRRGYVPGRVQ